MPTVCIKLTKGQIIDCLEALTKLESRPVPKTDFSVMQRTHSSGKTADAPAMAAAKAAVRHFELYCRLLRLVDAQFAIEATARNQHAILFVARKFEEFFWRVVARVPPADVARWNAILADEKLSQEDVAVHVTRHAVNASKLRVFERRCDAEHTRHLQRIFRQELLKSEEFTMELDLETQKELIRANLMDVDDACVVIQCAERMYQAIARFCYLTEVRKKATDLHAEKGELDAQKAVVMIQARVRGFLARKRVREMRNAEQKMLGLDIEAMLYAQMAHRRARRAADAQQIRRVVEMADATAAARDDNNRMAASKMRQTNQTTSRHTVQLQLPETLTDYLEQIRADLFITDPLDLDVNTLKRITPKKGASQGNATPNSHETEALYARLAQSGACRTALGTARRPLRAFDELVSFETQIVVGRKHNFVFDLRGFLYVAAVIPHVCSSWPLKHARRAALLLTGAEGSGKSAWACALAHKCAATRVTISRAVLRRKNRATRFLNNVLQFVRRDKYVVVILDLMEIFDREVKEKKTSLKQMIRMFLRALLLEDQCLVVGLSRIETLEPTMLDQFTYTVRLRVPPDAVGRLQLLAENFSRRLENDTLARVPKRLAELSAAISALTCGDALRHVNKKFG